MAIVLLDRYDDYLPFCDPAHQKFISDRQMELLEKGVPLPNHCGAFKDGLIAISFFGFVPPAIFGFLFWGFVWTVEGFRSKD